jgi:plastocyanin
MRISKSLSIFLLLVIMLSGILAACQSIPTLASSTAPGISVGILGDECPSVEIKVGDQVTWTNQDARAHIVRHIPDEGNSQFDSGILNIGDSFSFIFVPPGEYTYQCLIEYESTGIVTVQP